MGNVNLGTIHKELHDLKKDIEFIKHAVSEDYELSALARKELSEARKVPDSDLISHDDLKKRILGK